MSIATSIIVLKFHFRGHNKERISETLKKLLLMPVGTNSNLTVHQVNMQSKEIKSINIHGKETDLNSHGKETDLNSSILRLLSKILKSTKTTNKLLMKEKIKLTKIEMIRTEWKEAARRIDRFLFMFSVCIIILVPIILFSKYLFIEPFKLDRTCKCNLE